MLTESLIHQGVGTMQPTQEYEDDFADLDAIIATGEAKRAESRAIMAKQKRLAKGNLTEDERLTLTAELRAWEDAYVWTTVAAVALFHTQACVTCGHKHRFFMGWMTQQNHKRDPNCRRFVRGKPIEPVPRRIEEHSQPAAEMCSDCAEACLVIEGFIKD